jgi:hypothetical protein
MPTAADFEKVKRRLKFDKQIADIVRRRLAGERKYYPKWKLEEIIRDELDSQIPRIMSKGR